MSKEELKALADRTSLSNVIFTLGNLVNVEIPIPKSLYEESIEELNLSVRSRNGLMRARLDTIGKITEMMMYEGSIEGVRNLGKKSVYEIKRAVLDAAYDALDDANRVQVIDRLMEINQ